MIGVTGTMIARHLLGRVFWLATFGPVRDWFKLAREMRELTERTHELLARIEREQAERALVQEAEPARSRSAWLS